jgi:hypothetical protein
VALHCTYDVLDLCFLKIMGIRGSLSFILFVLVLGAGGYNRKCGIHILYCCHLTGQGMYYVGSFSEKNDDLDYKIS